MVDGIDHQEFLDRLPNTFVFDEAWDIVSDMMNESKCDREIVSYLLSVLSYEHIRVHIIDYEKTYYTKMNNAGPPPGQQQNNLPPIPPPGS